MEINKVKEIIIKVFYFLEEEYNYTTIFKKTQGDVFIESCEVEYSNAILRREINVSYTKGLVNNINRHTFTVSIVRLPYSGVEDFFVLEHYLKSKGRIINVNFDNELDENELRIRLNEISELMKSDLIEVIKGELWYENFYPRID